MIDGNYLLVAGNPYHRYQAQGRAFRQHYSRMLSAATKIAILPAWLQNLIPEFIFKKFIHIKGARLYKLHEPVLKNFNGSNLLQKLEGLCDGLNTNRDFLYGLNAIEILSSQMPYALGCTSLAFPQRLLKGQGVQIAYNHDFPEVLRPYLFVRETHPDQGYASLAITYPPSLGAIAGVNEAGLAATLNHGYEKNLKAQPSLLITLLLQECLDRCGNVVEAETLIKKTKVPNGSFITLVDRSGRRLVYELSSHRKMTRGADADLLVTFNKYKVKAMEADEIPITAKGKGPYKGHLVHEHSLEREKRFRVLFDPSKKYSDVMIRKLMSDHAGANNGHFGTICRHDPGTASTLISAIINPRGFIKLVFDNPCRATSYQIYYLRPPKRVPASKLRNRRIKMKR